MQNPKSKESSQREAGALIAKLPADQQKGGGESRTAGKKARTIKSRTALIFGVGRELLEASKFAKIFANNLVGTMGQLGKMIRPDFSLPGGAEDER